MTSLARRGWLLTCLVAVLACAGAAGCLAPSAVTVRKTPQNPLAGPLSLLADTGPRPTKRTEQFLRQSDLASALRLPPRQMLAEITDHVAREPSAQGTYAVAELAYLEGVKAQHRRDDELALDLLGISVSHAYMYLLDDRYASERNQYDPQYRRACELYNCSLEQTLRIVAARGDLRPGHVHTCHSGKRQFDVEIVSRGRWRTDEIERFEFASDFRVNNLANLHHTYGLGVPLIAVRKTACTEHPSEQFYPPNLTFPITAFLRVDGRNEGRAAWDSHAGQAAAAEQNVRRCTLELHDPLDATELIANRRNVPLESDLSVPLAYFLNQPAFSPTSLKNIAYLGFLNPNAGRKIQGLYMLEPFDPDKIPVIFVHGLASSPVTWTDMYNDLRADPQIGRHFQFWFYFYATGQPFWVSGTQFRVDLAEALKELDPEGNAPRLDEIVLVGHSMGGLVSKLQTIESGDDFWHLVSDRSPEELQGTQEAKMALLSAVYFKPNPSVRRVVTIGTPHRGSQFANPLTRSVTRAVAELPNMLIRTKRQLIWENPGFFNDTELLTIDTGVDSLIPESPFFEPMLHSPKAEWVKYHNIVGVVDERDILGRISGEPGDGVVSLASARVPNAESEISVAAGHTSIHSHPKSIREVQRILREHLGEMVAQQRFQLASYPAGGPRPLGPRRGYRFEDHYPPNR